MSFKNLWITENIQIELCQSVSRFIKDHNIQPTCDLIKEKVLKHLKGNELDHSHENAIKIAFLLSFNLSGYQTNLEIEFKEESEQSFTNCADLVVPDQKIHI